jgi:hypothetical protein
MGMKPLPGEYATYEWFSRDAETWPCGGDTVTIEDTDFTVTRMDPSEIPGSRHSEASGTNGGTRTARYGNTPKSPRTTTARKPSEALEPVDAPKNASKSLETPQRAVEGRNRRNSAGKPAVKTEKPGKRSNNTRKTATQKASKGRAKRVKK